MTARDRLSLSDRSPTPARFPAPDLLTEVIPAGLIPAGDDDGKFSLSITQILASTAAAVTAALIGSKLGVAGTLVGAALASIVSGVGAAIYGHSLLVTRRQMRRALQLVRPAGETPVAAPATAAVGRVPGVRYSGPTRNSAADDDLTVLMPALTPPIVRVRRGAGRRRTVAAALAGVAAAGVIFAGAIATVTLVEAVKGAPLSGGDSGLSVLGGHGSSGPSTDPATVTVTSQAPSSPAPSTTVTQTVTQSPTASSEAAERSTAPTTAPTSPAATGTATASAQSPVLPGAAGQQAPTTAPAAP